MEREIRVAPRTISNLSERGTTEEEVRLVVRTGTVSPSRFGRFIARHVLTDGYQQNNRFYPHKEVSVVYVTERNIIITVTIKTRFGFWEESK